MAPENAIPTLLAIAWLLPLASFLAISIGYSLPQLFGGRACYERSRYAAYIAVGAIGTGFVLSMIALFGFWLPAHPLSDASHHDTEHHDDHATAEPASAGRHLTANSSPTPFQFTALAQLEPTVEEADEEHASTTEKPAYTNDWYTLGTFGDLKLTIGYYIDTLTLVMFCMVTLIATCVHVYAMGYMHDELHDFTDPEVEVNGQKLHRPGRFHRFFQYLSLFSFSMLGLVIAGNLAMVFVFWELVGICSYFLIGFYIERKSASTAANKAFIVNRVGDFGMLIGLMALWTSLGTFNFGDVPNEDGTPEPGVFSLLRTEANDRRLVPSDGMVAFEARDEIAAVALGQTDADAAITSRIAELRQDEDAHHGQWLLFVAGVGLFCGCVGKSAQFPLHTWLPDAMEGPTPVSALVHSATMVAAGVYLVGRAYPIFTPEALLVIAVVGAITLFIAATIAVTQTDIKRVLAYSTVSQLGYMMLALGLGGWVAGLFHLITHAFFKGLLFLCSGSVIHAVHSNEMTDMGGLLKKMPVTAYSMLVGCLAIIGAGIPLAGWGMSGYYSKDAIIEQSLSYTQSNEWNGTLSLLFLMPTVGAAITAFYMFRMWFMTFLGEPRDHHRYEHAHESPRVMTVPLIVLAVFAVSVGWSFPGTNLSVRNLLAQAQPMGTDVSANGSLMPELVVPAEHLSHAPSIVMMAGLLAFAMALLGVGLAAFIYVWQHVKPSTLKTALLPLWKISWHKWGFDELYDWIFVKPTLTVGALAAGNDRNVIDRFIHAIAFVVRQMLSSVAKWFDRQFIDAFVDGVAAWTWRSGNSLRRVQTGHLRQYVLFIVIGTFMLVLIATLWKAAIAG
jgi:NADH-quinone oxidoreductase subunit L